MFLPIKCLNSCEEFFVVPAVYEDLGVVFNGLRQYRKGSGVELLLLPLVQLLGSHLTLRLLHESTAKKKDKFRSPQKDNFIPGV